MVAQIHTTTITKRDAFFELVLNSVSGYDKRACIITTQTSASIGYHTAKNVLKHKLSVEKL